MDLSGKIKQKEAELTEIKRQVNLHREALEEFTRQQHRTEGAYLVLQELAAEQAQQKKAPPPDGDNGGQKPPAPKPKNQRKPNHPKEGGETGK